MKLLLTSAGFTTPEIVAACVELCEKPKESITFAVINEAYAVDGHDKRWVINDLNNIAGNFSGEIDLVNLLALDKESVRKRIATKDVIFVIGGQTDYLMSVFNRTDFSSLLQELLTDKVYVGSSAGAMVIGKRISTTLYTEVYGETDDYGIDEYMNIVDFGIVPHMGSADFKNSNPEVLENICKGVPFKIQGLKDDSAIVINDGTMSIVGSDPYLVGGSNKA